MSAAIHPPPPLGFPNAARIVGLGASAGGLSALEKFISQVPTGSGFAYVVVQHMDPTHEALLSTLLQRVTSMPVREVTDAMAVQPDGVYVIPPGYEMTVGGGHLRLVAVHPPRGRRLAIDVLLRSLARDQGPQAIGVVLSGMGADGTLGLKEIKRRGGLTLAQQPESAQFDSMPKNAIASGCVDIIALPEAMPACIARAAAREAAPPAPQRPDEGQTDALGAILLLLRNHCKHDLSLYKVSTLQRRIERRVAVHKLDSMPAYAQFLQNNPQELDLLFAEVLIGVTHFFRDPDVWIDLKETVLPRLLAQRTDDAPLRAWIVGCSTGEEAYSLAMVFREMVDAQPQIPHRTLQIFATDLSADAIAVARNGLYPAKAAQGMAPDRVARFFHAQTGGLLIDRSIRDMVLFTRHDVILDPPFTRLDLLACRNVLIYFNTVLQQRLMPLFHYSLRPGGVLLLGGSETVGRSQSLFTPLSPKSRLYRRTDHALNAGAVDFPVNRHRASHKSEQETHVPTPFTHTTNLQTLADQVLLQTFSPPAVLVNEAGDILYISGRTGRYLEPAAGKANWNIHVMARPGLRTQLAVALRQAFREKTAVELSGLQIEEDTPRTVNVTVQAVQEPKALQGMVMVVFREVAAPRASRARKGQTQAPLDDSLRQELERAHEEISALRKEMQASKEELQSTNEALQSANEELQSANEELTTSKEEAQSMNEELQTINSELQTKLDDLALAQSDMQNLLNSTDIATLFLDNDLNVRRFTEKATGIFHLREGDIGRPLSDLASTLVYPQLHSDAKETLRTLTPGLQQIATTDGRWFSVRIMPYRTLTNMIQGVVLTFVEITVAKELEFRLREGYSRK